MEEAIRLLEQVVEETETLSNSLERMTFSQASYNYCLEMLKNVETIKEYLRTL